MALHEAVDAVVAGEKSTEQPASTSRIVLDVGGKRYATTISTLCSCPGMLSAMFSRHTVAFEPDGSVFIDRNGDLFTHVLEFLRNASRWQPPADVDSSALLNEAQYFGLQPMLDKLQPASPSTVQLHNARRVGSVLTLVDPTEDGSALFRPSNRDAFSIGIQLLQGNQEVFFTLVETQSSNRWRFSTRDGTLRYNNGGDAVLAFGPGPHLHHHDDNFQSFRAKAGDIIKLNFLRGDANSPCRLYFTHNDVPSDEQLSLNSSGGPPLNADKALPLDGDYVVEIHLIARIFTLAPEEDGTRHPQDLEEAVNSDDHDLEDATPEESFELGAKHGIQFAADHCRLYAGTVGVLDWKSSTWLE